MEKHNWRYSLFENIDEKHSLTFTMFDIKYFRMPIKETLLKNVTEFAVEHTDINKNDFEVIFLARKSFLFHSNQLWVKRGYNTFDVTIGT